MSHDPTMEPTVLDEIRYVVEDIVSNIGGSTYLRTTGKLELELSEHIEMVVSSGDSPGFVLHGRKTITNRRVYHEPRPRRNE